MQKGTNIHVVEVPSELVGVTFRQACRCFHDAVLFGVQSSNRDILEDGLIPPGNYILEEGDRVVVLALSALEAVKVDAAKAVPYSSQVDRWSAPEELLQDDGQLKLGPAAGGAKASSAARLIPLTSPVLLWAGHSRDRLSPGFPRLPRESGRALRLGGSVNTADALSE